MYEVGFIVALATEYQVGFIVALATEHVCLNPNFLASPEKVSLSFLSSYSLFVGLYYDMKTKRSLHFHPDWYTAAGSATFLPRLPAKACVCLYFSPPVAVLPASFYQRGTLIFPSILLHGGPREVGSTLNLREAQHLTPAQARLVGPYRLQKPGECYPYPLSGLRHGAGHKLCLLYTSDAADE